MTPLGQRVRRQRRDRRCHRLGGRIATSSGEIQVRSPPREGPDHRNSPDPATPRRSGRHAPLASDRCPGQMVVHGQMSRIGHRAAPRRPRVNNPGQPPGRRRAASPETASSRPAIRKVRGPDHAMGVMDSMRPRARSPQPGTSRPGVSSLGTSGAGGGPAKPWERRPRRQVGQAIPPDRSRTRSTVRPITLRLPRPTAHRNPR